MGVDGLLPRWNSILGNKKLIINSLRDLLPYIKPNNRGQPPKQPIKDYVLIIILKEYKTASLREAETDWSEYVCGRPIDHSTIHYWEKNIDPKYLEKCIRVIGSKLEELISYEFSVIDATSFSSWHMDTTGFHLVNRIGNGTVYPVSVCPDTFSPVHNTRDSIIPGEGLFMGDKWYDVNGVFRIVYKNGYTPLISPQRTRCSGNWRRKARKIYAKQWMKYRQRSRGESVFGSLTNAYGDRLHTRRKKPTYIRCLSRIISYQIRILIRTGNGLTIVMILVRHALFIIQTFKYIVTNISIS